MAKFKEEAFDKVYEQYTESYIVLDADDFKDFEIKEYKE